MSISGLGFRGEVLLHGPNPWGNKVAAVVVRSPTEHVAVDDAWFVDVDAATDFKVELALGHGRHAKSVNDSGAGGDFDAVANTGHREAFLPEPAGDAKEVFVFADVFRGASATEEDADIVFGFDVFEGDVGLDGVALPFLGDGPARLYLVENHLVSSFFGCGDDGLEAGFDDAVEGVEGIDGFRGIADDDEHFGFIHVS
jgi:hypothetical protein